MKFSKFEKIILIINIINVINWTYFSLPLILWYFGTDINYDNYYYCFKWITEFELLSFYFIIIGLLLSISHLIISLNRKNYNKSFFIINTIIVSIFLFLFMFFAWHY